MVKKKLRIECKNGFCFRLIHFFFFSLNFHVLFLNTTLGVGCGRPKVPAVYVNIAHYIDWIEEKVQG